MKERHKSQTAKLWNTMTNPQEDWEELSDLKRKLANKEKSFQKQRLKVTWEQIEQISKYSKANKG